MRKTVTLDADTDELIRRRMNERRLSFKQALNDAIREGLGSVHRPDFRTPTKSMDQPIVNLDRALQFAAVFENDELIRQRRQDE